MKFVAILLASFIATTAAQANQVLVSVGQLADATRLVLTFEDRPDWQASKIENGVELKFASSNWTVDVASGNALVDGTRISSVNIGQDRDRLMVEYTCDCTSQVYAHGESSLIVEVRDTPKLAPVENAMTTAPDQPIAPSAESIVGIPDAMTQPVVRQASIQLMPVEALLIYPPKPPTVSWRSSSLELELVETLGFSIGSNLDSQAVALLSRGLSRATAQGLIEPERLPEKRRTANPLKGSEQLAEGRSNISIVTGLDRDLLSSSLETRPTDQGQVCFPDAEVDLAAWGDTSDFRTLGSLRRNAFAEDGAVRPEGAQAVARYYIALGFGSEAKVAASYMNEGFQKELILALADIVDHGFSTSSILDGQVFCEGAVSLWAALARPISPEGTPKSKKSVLATFSALPPHLRAHLGPVLAERLRSVGLEDEARNAVNAVARGGLQSNESELVTARMELDGTRPEKARGTLVDLSNGTDVTAAEALLELLLDAERRGMAPNPAWVEDAPSLARATEGTDVAAAVNLAGLRGRIELDQFEKLRKALEDETPGLTDATRNDLAVSALVAAAERADDVVFLTSEVGLSKLFDIDTIERGSRFEIARRLLNIGLPDRAEIYLPTIPEDIEEVTTVANTWNDLGRSDQAIALLSGQAQKDTARRLAEILSQTGMNEEAIVAYQNSGALTEATNAALRAGNWDWITNNTGDGEEELAETAERLTSSLPQPTSADEPMNGALIRSSQVRRKSARMLLERTQISNSPLSFTN